MALETLLNNVRHDPRIGGIKIDNTETKLIAFADDMTTILHDKTSLEHLFVTLQHFEKCSGLKVNEDKTEPTGWEVVTIANRF